MWPTCILWPNFLCSTAKIQNSTPNIFGIVLLIPKRCHMTPCCTQILGGYLLDKNTTFGVLSWPWGLQVQITNQMITNYFQSNILSFGTHLINDSGRHNRLTVFGACLSLLRMYVHFKKPGKNGSTLQLISMVSVTSLPCRQCEYANLRLLIKMRAL